MQHIIEFRAHKAIGEKWRRRTTTTLSFSRVNNKRKNIILKTDRPTHTPHPSPSTEQKPVFIYTSDVCSLRSVRVFIRLGVYHSICSQGNPTRTAKRNKRVKYLRSVLVGQFVHIVHRHRVRSYYVLLVELRLKFMYPISSFGRREENKKNQQQNANNNNGNENNELKNRIEPSEWGE